MPPLNSLFQFNGGTKNYVERDDNVARNDSPVVSRVHTQRQRDEENRGDFMAQLLQAITQMQQGRETSAQKAAARRDPTAEHNRLRQTPGTAEFSGFGPGGNRLDPQKGVVGPVTDALGYTPEMIARMQGRTARNQWMFPEMFKADDQRAVGNTIKEHNGMEYIRGQQAGVVPTTDFRQVDPNMAGRYEGTNVLDFLHSEMARRAQEKVDGFDPAPAGTVRRIIPKASYGTTPGYATNGPRKPAGFSFGSTAPRI